MSFSFLKAREAFFDRLFHRAGLEDEKLIKWNENPGELSGIHGAGLAFVLASQWRKQKQTVLIIVPTDKIAAALYNDLQVFLGKEQISYFPDLGTLPYEDISPSYFTLAKRIDAACRLVENRPGIVVAEGKAVCRYGLPRSLISESILILEKGQSYERSGILEKLETLSYRRVPEVREPGEYAIRGSVMDIFSPSRTAPARLDFFDRELEEIRLFHTDSQTSFAALEKFRILPRRDIWVPPDRVESHLPLIRKRFGGAVDGDEFESKLLAGRLRNIHDCLPLFFEDLETLPEYAHPDTIFYVYDPEAVRHRVEEHIRYYEEHHRMDSKRFQVKEKPSRLFCREFLSRRKYHSLHRHVKSLSGVSLAIQGFAHFHSRIQMTMDSLRSRIKEQFSLVITSPHPGQVESLRRIFEDLKPSCLSEANISPPSLDAPLVFLQAGLSEGFIYETARLQFISENELFGRRKKVNKNFSHDANRLIENLADLKEGNLVVHINHGIGRYQGLKLMTISGKTKDFLKIEYAGNSHLFVPVEQMNFIQRYTAGSERPVHLDALGGRAWDKVKQRIKQSVENMVRELIDLYSRREGEYKRPFQPESYWQTQFDLEFPFEETQDQIKAFETVKRDMERAKPMDRLICGDTGFGKTEVAMRATFKCAVDGRQCLLLCPTTILAQQHYRSFVERFKNFPIAVEVLNRFRSPAEQRSILRRFTEGRIEILIGTHRLLSDDVRPRDLGLLVIDEEQKFGVKHKEKIRRLAELVDTLAMSATPIPRTLYMSLNHIRSISVINTPPLDRKPVQVLVHPFDLDILIEAVQRERGREGQMYFLHNRVETIPKTFEFLKQKLPGLRLGVAHGRMQEHQLEDVMNDFILGRYDMLLSTSIIDAGLDIANVNTIFIDRSENLGLAQLYQLKGRVGRSVRQGYAYFFYDPERELSEKAAKRLQALGEHTALGSGFKIAMKDLEIRGAGNVLGKEQSGNIMAVGFELYCRLLNEAIEASQAKDGGDPKVPETVVDVKYDGHIPDAYISDQREKLEVYRKIASVNSEAEVETVRAELVDRFGIYPAPLERLFSLSLFRLRLSFLGVRSLVEKGDQIAINLRDETHLDKDTLLQSVERGEVILDPERPSMFFFQLPKRFQESRGEELARKLHSIETFLSSIFN